MREGKKISNLKWAVMLHVLLPVEGSLPDGQRLLRCALSLSELNGIMTIWVEEV
jgi:hypothetical protein